jgi:hypothetical protein
LLEVGTVQQYLLTDGNQTSGNDYIYSFDETNKVFPIVLGDTTKIVDLKSVRLTLTNMPFSKINVEVFLNYSGDKIYLLILP